MFSFSFGFVIPVFSDEGLILKRTPWYCVTYIDRLGRKFCGEMVRH